MKGDAFFSLCPVFRIVRICIQRISDAIHHISVCRRNLDAYLLPLILVARPKLELKRGGKGILAHRYLHFFGMNAFDGEINHLSGAHNLSKPVQRWTLVGCYQAIVRIIYVILNGKIEGYIHPIPIGSCKLNSGNIPVPVQRQFGIGRTEVVDKHVSVTTIKLPKDKKTDRQVQESFHIVSRLFILFCSLPTKVTYIFRNSIQTCKKLLINQTVLSTPPMISMPGSRADASGNNHS